MLNLNILDDLVIKPKDSDNNRISPSFLAEILKHPPYCNTILTFPAFTSASWEMRKCL